MIAPLSVKFRLMPPFTMKTHKYDKQTLRFEYSVFTNDGKEHVRFSNTGDTEEIMSQVLKEFEECDIDTVVLKTVPRLIF